MRNTPFVGLLLILGLSACEETPATSKVVPYIQPPIPTLVQAFEEKEIEAAEPSTFVAKSGSSISIPANAWVNQEGQPVSGKVTFQYREYQDASDIMLSGIPMAYDTAGIKRHLETAGMFELRATQNGQSLKVAPGKTLKTTLASQTYGYDYGGYFLDEEAKNWKYTGPTSAKENRDKKLLKDKLAKLIPQRPFPLSEKYLCLNYSMIVDVIYNNDLRNVDTSLVQQKIKQYGIKYANINCWNYVKFNGSDYPPAMFLWKRTGKGNPFDKSLENLENKTTHIAGNRYLFTFFKDDKHTDSINVELERDMFISELFKFPADYWAKNYAEAMARIEVERERMKLMADMYREMEISQVGIYNYDRLMKENPVELAATFKFDEDFDKEVSDVDMMFFVPGSQRSVIKLPKDKWSKLPMVADEKGKLICVLPKGKVALYDTPKYSVIDFEKLKKETQPAFVFDMKSEAGVVDGATALRKILER